MGLSADEVRILAEIEQNLTHENPRLDRKLHHPGYRWLFWAKLLGVLWLPLIVTGDAIGQIVFGVAGIVILAAALWCGLIGAARTAGRLPAD